MRDSRSLLETMRASRSQINSLSRLWSDPRGAAGSLGVPMESWWHGKSTMTTPRAHTPSRLLTTTIRGPRVQPGPPPSHEFRPTIRTVLRIAEPSLPQPPRHRSLLPKHSALRFRAMLKSSPPSNANACLPAIAWLPINQLPLLPFLLRLFTPRVLNSDSSYASLALYRLALLGFPAGYRYRCFELRSADIKFNLRFSSLENASVIPKLGGRRGSWISS